MTMTLSHVFMQSLFGTRLQFFPVWDVDVSFVSGALIGHSPSHGASFSFLQGFPGRVREGLHDFLVAGLVWSDFARKQIYSEMICCLL